MKKSVISILLGLLVFANIALADPTEYLFSNENLDQIDMNVEINNLNYQIYNISNSQEGKLLIVDPEGIPSDEIIEKNLVTYYTYQYIKGHEDEIDSYFHKTINHLDEKKESNYQKILDAFKGIQEQCIVIPSFQILKFCVKPSDKLEIMKVDLLITKILPDWNIAFENYKKLGGDITYLADKSEIMKYNLIEDTYKDITATHYFLTAAKEITGENFIENDVITPQKIVNEVNANVNLEFNNIKNRLTKLKNSEKLELDEVITKIGEINIQLKRIASINGNLNDIETERNSLKSEIDSISLNDQKFRTDIDHLANISKKIGELKIKAENSYFSQFNIHQNENFLFKIFDGIIGFARSLFY